MQKLLFEAMDKELDVIASSIERSYDPFFNKFSDLDLFHDNENRFLEYYMIVYDKNGNPIYDSPLSTFISFDIPLIENKIEDGYTLKTNITKKIPFLKPSPQGERMLFRLICKQLLYNHQRVGWIKIGLSIEHIEESMENLLDVLLGSILLSILLLALASYLLTGKTLNPVNIITKKANQISQNNLEENTGSG